MVAHPRVGDEKKKDTSGNNLFVYYMTFLKHVADLWKMDFTKLFFEIDASEKCHRDVATPHAVIVGQDFSTISIHIDFTLILKNLTMIVAIPALVALHYCTDVHYTTRTPIYCLSFCKNKFVSCNHKPGKENYSMQCALIQAYQQVIGDYLYKSALAIVFGCVRPVKEITSVSLSLLFSLSRDISNDSTHVFL
jgi:hypothetical protein